MRSELIPSRSGRAWPVTAGSRLRVIDVHGGQTGDVFAVFMRVGVAPDGHLTIQPPLATAGLGVPFGAERDVLVAVSACPAATANGGGPRPLAAEIGEAT